MASIQVLVNNLLYDFSQLGIPTDQVDPEYLEKPRRWNIDSIKKFMIYMGPTSSVFDYTTFFLMLYFFHCIRYTNPATPPTMKSYYESLFHTGWFVESILTQTLIVHVIRTNRIPFIQSRASVSLSLTTLAVMLAGIYLPYSPLSSYLGFVKLPPVYWLWIAVTLVAYVVLAHGVKTWFIRKFGID